MIHFDDPLEQSLPNNIGTDDKNMSARLFFVAALAYPETSWILTSFTIPFWNGWDPEKAAIAIDPQRGL